ncbi:unnamed protein product [Moneuplotes crassus]|uniref:Uncharacterized protein n=1 Tax=Euplotes crassus TaxID=5936 RepID=A0AAD1XJ25_EUPCR|nr:unnamed protein product [Moneuplotes crassus]
MLFYKPEAYLLPKMQKTELQPLGKKVNPVRGEAGDPAIPPTRNHTILKRGPSSELKPRFLRDSLTNNDIIGAKPRKLFEGRAKNNLTNRDIEGSSPLRLKPRNISEYNIFDYTDVNFKPSARARRSPAPIPTLRVKRPNGESFYMETNGDQLMRSAHSSRLDPYHMSHYRVKKFDDTNSINFSPKTKFQKLGEMIKNQSRLEKHSIEKPQNLSMLARNKSEIIIKNEKNRDVAKLNNSVMIPGTNEGLEDPYDNFYRNFTRNRRQSPPNFQAYGNMNSSKLNDHLRTRPTNTIKLDVGGSEELPSIQKFNKRGKLY